MRLFILKGETPENLLKYEENPDKYKQEVADGINAWGDEGEQSVFLNRMKVNINITQNLKLNLMHEFYYRHGNDRYYPSLTGKSNEWKAGLVYSL